MVEGKARELDSPEGNSFCGFYSWKLHIFYIIIKWNLAMIIPTKMLKATVDHNLYQGIILNYYITDGISLRTQETKILRCFLSMILLV